MVNTIDNLDPVRWIPAPARGPAFAALHGWFARHWPRRTPATPYDELTELDAHTLADIGAPERLLARAMARRDVQRQGRESLRIGLASGAWHHW
ncbi:MAG: hypothetical protein V4569_04060 [Pseudomonadota bacterium]